MTHRSIVILDAAVLGPMRRSPGRTVLAVLAIALGVALGFTVYLINRAAADEVSRAARSLFGVADLAVEAGPAGLDETIYPAVARVPGIEVASPLVEVMAKLANQRRPLKVIGIDAFRSRLLQPSLATLAGTMSEGSVGALDPQALFISADAAGELQLRQGDMLELQVGLQSVAFRIAAILPSQALEQRAAIVDIATAQWKFAQLGKLSRINVRLAAGSNEQQVRAALGGLLPADARVVTPGEATSDALRLSSAYRSNLTALALVALFTGGFLVYSTQTLAVLRRRREFALLHALGVTNRQQIAFSLGSGAAIGALGAMVGIVLGAVAASYALASLGTDMGAGYFRSGAVRLELSVLEVLAFASLGCATAIAGTLRPAWETTKIPTAAALKSGDVASGQVVSHRVLSVMLVAIAAAILWLPPLGTLPLPGYASIALLIFASVTAVATIVRRVLLMLPAVRAVPFQIAVAHLIGTARYVTLSVAAIVVSFSLMVAMLIMVTSFRSSLDAWTQKILPADVYLRAGYVGQTAFFDAATIERLRSLPGIKRMQTGRFAQISLDPERPAVALVARSFDPAQIEDVIWIERRTDAVLPANTVPVWISEAAADLYRLQPGSKLSLPLNGRRVEASVRGLWRDYEHQNGAVLMQRDTYEKLTGDSAVNTVGVWTDAAVPIAEVIKQIRQLIPAAAAFDLRVPQELRKISLAVFDRTFAVTYLLEIVAVVIGLLGISASTSAQVLARRGEFGVLRYIGLTRRQIATTLGIEGLLLGSVGVAIGVVTGIVVSMILIYVVNRQSFHWSMDVFIPWTALAVLSAVVAGASALIAILSGRRAMSGDVVAAVKEDW